MSDLEVEFKNLQASMVQLMECMGGAFNERILVSQLATAITVIEFIQKEKLDATDIEQLKLRMLALQKRTEQG